MSDLLPESLDFWDSTPGSPSSQISFGAGEPEFETASIWRLSFTNDMKEAERRLNRAESLLAESELALDSVPESVQRVIAVAGSGARGEIEFDISYAISPPESMLLADIAWLTSGTSQPSFDVEAGEAQERAKIFADFQNSLDRLVHQVTNFAWVETDMEGRLLARTAVSWTGDTNTIWLQAANPEQFNLHARALELALASRKLLLRMLVVSGKAASRLAILIAAPGGAALALPLAWKFVRQTLNEIESVRELSNT